MDEKFDVIERVISVGMVVLGVLIGNYIIAGLGVAYFIMKIK